ncbi:MULTISPECIES: hypothetical protein [Burkholderia]|uniref:hypothetical protein n=1 Tax=Burkholderia TaxID=32008 RepID=UPI00158EF9AB|nr:MULTISPECIES: hypothetical protein [Burkholderia]
MSDNRPEGLTTHQEEASSNNDKLILGALEQLEDPKSRGKRKATVAAMCELTALSRNTIRSRQWALTRLRALKQKLRAGDPNEAVNGAADEGVSEPTIDGIRDRLRQVLRQNVLLFEEILTLQGVIEKKDQEIRTILARQSIAIVPSSEHGTK